jgi:putative ABC transport system permease protein
MLGGTVTLFRGIILKHLRARKGRALLSVAGIVFGVTLLVAILLTNQAVTRSFTNSMVVLAARADLQVYGDWAGLDPGVLGGVRRDPGVEAAAPILEITANLPRLHDGVLLVGIDFNQDPRVRRYGSFAGRVYVPDIFTLGEDKYALIATDEFLQRHGLNLNDSVEIITPQGLKPFNVRGVIETKNNVSAMSGNWAIMEIGALREVFGRSERLSRLDLFLKPGADAGEVSARLSRALGPAVRVERPWVRSRAIERMVEGIQLTLTMLGFVGLIVGVFLIYNTTSVSVIERHHEIGVLRACGATRRQVLGIFLLEGFCYGLVGALLGTLLGIGAAKASLAYVSQSISSAYFVLLKIGSLPVSPWVVAAGLLSGVAASLAGALYPALAASRMSPLEVIRRRNFRSDIRYNLRTALAVSVCLLLLAGLSLLLHYLFGVKYTGYVALLALVLAVAVSSPLAVSLLASAVSGLFAKWFGIEGRLAVENILRNPARTGFTAAALVIGLAVIINTAGAITSLRGSIDSWIARIFSGDIIVAAHNPFTAGSVSAPLRETLVQDLLSVEGVSRASAIRYAKVTYQDTLISLLAVEGSLPGSGAAAGGGGPTVHVSKNFAELFDIRPGQTITLTTNEGETRFTVAGLIEDYNYNWPKGTIIVDRELYRRLWSDTLVDQIILYTAPGADAEAVRREIVSRYAGEYNLTVFGNREFRGNFLQIIDQQFSLTYAQLLITTVVVLFAVANTLLISVISRRGEIGVLRALGASMRQNRKIVLLEASVLGLSGVVYGTLLGLLMTLIFVKVSLPEQTGWEVGFVFPWVGVALGVVAALAVSILGSVIPVREIGRIQVTRLMRHEA